MSLTDLEAFIVAVRESAQKHGVLLRGSEALTRYVLIDPVLRALGWDTENPDLVRPEYAVAGGAADYALFDKGQPLVFVEAKSLGQSLAQGVQQGIQRCMNTGTMYFVVTDGAKYEIYDVHKPVPLDQKRVVAFDIAAGEVREAVINLLCLWKPGATPRQPLAPATTVPAPAATQVVSVPLTTPSAPPASGATATGWTSLSSLVVKTNQPQPVSIRLPDGSVRVVEYWNQVLLFTVEYLVAKGLLTQQECPIRLPDAIRYFVHSSPVHSDGKPFFAPRQVGSLWVEVNSSTTLLVKSCVFLLNHVGQSPDSVKLNISPGVR